MKYLPTILASLVLSVSSWAGTAGVTTHHQVACSTSNQIVTCTRTSWIVYNLTAYDQLALHGPDSILRYGPKYLHKTLRNWATDPKIGATTVNVGHGSGGGGGGKHENGPTGENGFTMYQTRWNGAVTATFIKDAFTCGSVYYTATTSYNSAWRFDSANYVPCPSPSPVPSSSSTASPTFWELIFEEKDGGPASGEITEWTDQMELDYFNVYGVWAKH